MVEGRKMWDEHWRKGAFHNNEHRAIINACKAILGNNLSGLKVLEVGSGRGVDSVKLAELGAEVCMVDYSMLSFHLSTDLAQKRNVRVKPILADAASLPFIDASFDLVFSQGVMEHGDNLKLLTEQARVIKQGGYVIIDVPQVYSFQAINKAIQVKLGRWPYGEEKSYSKKAVEQMLRQVGLTPVYAYGWELLPMMHLGIRSLFHRFRKLEVEKSRLVPQVQPSTLDSLLDRFEQSPLAPRVMNNVGVVGIK